MWGNNFTFQVYWLSREIPNSEDLAINEAKGNTDSLKGVHFFSSTNEREHGKWKSEFLNDLMKSQMKTIQWFVNHFKGMDIIKIAPACNCNKIMNHTQMIYHNYWLRQKYRRSVHSGRDEKKLKWKIIVRHFLCNDTTSFDSGYHERHLVPC